MVRRENSCDVCSREHKIAVCPRFLNMGMTERLRTVVLHRYCERCLSRAHRSSACSSRGRCSICQGSHHSLLHYELSGSRRFRLPRNHGTAASEVSSRRARDESPSRRLTVEARPTRRGMGSCRRSARSPREPRQPRRTAVDARHRINNTNTIPINNGITIQPTAKVKMVLNGKLWYVRALIDPGSAVSRISESLARKLRLPEIRTEGYTVAPLTLRGRNGCLDSVQVSARVSRGYRVTAPAAAINSSVRDVFPGLILADSRFYEPSDVELVLGMDVYPQILRTGFQKAVTSQLVAQYTMFGYILSGNYIA